MSTTVEQTTTLPDFEEWPVRQPSVIEEEAARLDRLWPGWHNRINTDTLHLMNTERCVLGQGAYRCDSRGRKRSIDYTASYNRVVDDGYVGYAGAYCLDTKFRGEWIEEIQKRRA